MPDRLSSLDASFLYLEQPTTVMHLGSVMVFDGTPEGIDEEQLLALVESRIGDQSRYRSRVRKLPGRVAQPVWVDDPSFDIAYHVRHSALPRPGTAQQLAEFVGRIQSRPLDREHPLWELYLVEGLQGGRFALVTKTHQAMIDGVNAVDLPQLLLDTTPAMPALDPPPWRARRSPTDLELLMGAALDAVRRPGQVVDMVRDSVDDVVSVGRRVTNAATDVVRAVAGRGAPQSTPLNTRVGATRRFCMVTADLGEFRRARNVSSSALDGADVTINDVVLAVVTGGLRAWLQTRGQPIHSGSTIKALVPLSVHDAGGSADRMVPSFVDLPIGEPSPQVRVEHIAHQMRRQQSGALAADAIAGLAGFAPPTLHHLGARLGSAMSRRLFNLVITNVPGPQEPRYVLGARMIASYPVMPLALGQAVAVGVTSYDGHISFGLNGDRTSMADLDLLGQCILEDLQMMAMTS